MRTIGGEGRPGRTPVLRTGSRDDLTHPEKDEAEDDKNSGRRDEAMTQRGTLHRHTADGTLRDRIARACLADRELEPAQLAERFGCTRRYAAEIRREVLSRPAAVPVYEHGPMGWE